MHGFMRCFDAGRPAGVVPGLLACAVLLLCAAMFGCSGKGAPDGGYGDFKTPPSGTFRPYTVKGRTYYPLRSAKGFREEGMASWYGPGFHGKSTASGETYNQYAMTAAHKILPMYSLVRVTNLENSRAVTVKINDRGPFAAGRVIDLSRAAAQRLGFMGKGTARVRVAGLDSKEDVAPMPIAEPKESEELSGSGPAVPAPVSEPREDEGAPDRQPAEPAPGFDSGEGGEPLDARDAAPEPEEEPIADAAPAPVAEGPVFVRLGLFSVRANALRAKEKARAKGYPAQIGRRKGAWMVSAGPWRTEQEAQEPRERLAPSFPGAFVEVGD